MEDGYAGWKNHETWCVALHIDNDREQSAKWLEAARISRISAKGREQVTSGVWSVEQAERFHLADRLKDSFELKIERVRNPLAQALAASALGNVDWDELADHYLTKLAESTTV